MVWTRIAALSLSAAAVFTSSCSLAVATDDVQCSTDADCEARGSSFAGTVCEASVCVKKATGECETDADCRAKGAGHEEDVCTNHVCETPEDPKWGCVGKVEPLPAGKVYTIKSTILDLITNQPPPGVTVKLCNKYDVPCATPLPLASNLLAADGSVTVDLPSDVEAYLEVTGGDYYPMLLVLDHVAEVNNPVTYAVPNGTVQSLATSTGVALDPAKGIVLIRTTDCTLDPTAGASVTIFPNSGETRFYTVSSTTNPNATQTDSAGNAGFVNVTPGTIQITGTIGPMGAPFGKISTLVRGGFMTAQILRPSPSL